MTAANTRRTPLVIKLGGSLAGSERLRAVLQMVTEAERPVVIVPGGGRFADTVRSEQHRLGLSNDAAHTMALLAMHEMAFVMAALQPDIEVAETVAEIGAALERNRVPVWAPFEMACQDASLPRDWSLTSDGLAAWLANVLGVPTVVLVKSCPIDRDATAAELARTGVVDPVFARLVVELGLDWHVCGGGDDSRLATLLLMPWPSSG